MKQLVEDRGQPVYVGARTDPARVAAGLLGRHVAGRAQHIACLRLVGVRVQQLRQAEVGHLRRSVRREQHVGRLDVAMDDAGVVCGLDRQGQRPHQRRRLARAERAVFHPPGQGAAVQQLHRDEWLAVFLAGVENLDDVGVPHAGDGLPFPTEPFAHRAVRRRGEADHFEGDEPVEAPVSCLPHHAHAAVGDPVEQLVAGEAARRGDRLVRPAQRQGFLPCRDRARRLQGNQPGRGGQLLAFRVVQLGRPRQVLPQFGHDRVVVAQVLDRRGAACAVAEMVGDCLHRGGVQPAGSKPGQDLQAGTAAASSGMGIEAHGVFL